MARLKYQQRAGLARGRGYFPQLAPLGSALDAVIASAPRSTPVPIGAEEIQERRDAQAAKLARRAARAGVAK